MRQFAGYRFFVVSLISISVTILAQGAVAQESGTTRIRGEVVSGTTDSAFGDYVFLNDSAVASKIFAVCRMSDTCEADAKILNEVIIEVSNIKKVSADGPPPADAVWDTRFVCLYGEMEGEVVPPNERLAACDALGKLESQALEAGYCWNQKRGEYATCE